jgi:putative transposase
MLMEIPPKYTIAEVIQKLKEHSAKYLFKRFKLLQRIYPRGGIWSTGYFVSSVGLNEEQIRKYIQLQNKYDRGEDITAEFS